MWKSFKYFPWVASGYLLISHIIGLAGIPEDLETWRQWINITYSLSKSMAINQNIIQGAFLFIGLLILYIYSGVHKKIWQKTRISKRPLTVPADSPLLVEDEEVIKDTSSPLKIEVQEDGNVYSHTGSSEGHGIKSGRRQTLSVKIHNTGKKSIDSVEVCINEFEVLSGDVQESAE